MIRAFGIITGLSCYVLLTASPAAASVFLCNNSNHDIALTVAESRGADFENDIVTIDGWHVLEASECKSVVESYGFLYVGMFVAFAYTDGGHVLLKDRSWTLESTDDSVWSMFSKDANLTDTYKSICIPNQPKRISDVSGKTYLSTSCPDDFTSFRSDFSVIRPAQFGDRVVITYNGVRIWLGN